MKPLRIGTRGSALALWQANRVRDALEKSCGVASEIVVIKTSGDHHADASLEQMGIQGVFHERAGGGAVFETPHRHRRSQHEGCSH